VEVASGSDPLDPIARRSIAVSQVGEAGQRRISAVNTVNPPGGFTEADSVTFSLLNTVSPAGGFREADSVTFSLLNTVFSGRRVQRGGSVTFSVCNSVSASVSGIYTQLCPDTNERASSSGASNHCS